MTITQDDVPELLLMAVGSVMYQMAYYTDEFMFEREWVRAVDNPDVLTWKLACTNRTTLRSAEYTLSWVDGPPEVEVYAESQPWQYCPMDLVGDEDAAIARAQEAFFMMLAVLRVPQLEKLPRPDERERDVPV
jgi:hypothetical protein